MYYCFTCPELKLDIEVDLETRVYGSVDPYVIVTGVYGESGDNLLDSSDPLLKAIAQAIMLDAESDKDFCDSAVREADHSARERAEELRWG